MKLMTHPQMMYAPPEMTPADLQKLYEDVGTATSHSGKVLAMTLGNAAPLHYHAMINGPWWPLRVDLVAERIRNQSSPPAARRMTDYIQRGSAEYFVVTQEVFPEVGEQKDLLAVLDCFPQMPDPTWNGAPGTQPRFIVFDLRHPLMPLPQQ